MTFVVRKIVGVVLLAGLLNYFCVAPRPLGSSFGGPGNVTYDYVVIGASSAPEFVWQQVELMYSGGGTAGIAIASRLAQGSHSVAVIEAGSFYEISNSNYSQIPVFSAAFTAKSPFQESPQVDWGFVTTPQPVSEFCQGRSLDIL